MDHRGPLLTDSVAVTTFSPRGYALYGRRFIESFLRFWPIPLVAFYESERPDLSDPRLMLKDLDHDQERAAFLRRYDRPEFRGLPGDYATQAIRFSHKVFALTSEALPGRWRLWLDADVETFAPVTEETLQRLCPDEADLSYLGRQNGQHSETGFIACRMDDPQVREMLTGIRQTYTSGAVFNLDPRKRNDSEVFDRMRVLVSQARQHNLSMHSAATHVWPDTALGAVMRHWKGQVRKREAYGPTAD